MTLEEAKDQAARACGFRDLQSAIKTARQGYFEENQLLLKVIDRAMQIYAEAKAKEFAEWICYSVYELSDGDFYHVDDKDGSNPLSAEELYNIFNNG